MTSEWFNLVRSWVSALQNVVPEKPRLHQSLMPNLKTMHYIRPKALFSRPTVLFASQEQFCEIPAVLPVLLMVWLTLCWCGLRFVTKGSVSYLSSPCFSTSLGGIGGPAHGIHGILAVMYWISIIGGEGGPPPPKMVMGSIPTGDAVTGPHIRGTLCMREMSP